ncbi:hypothetical protein ABR33_05990 [Enterobacter bugandensis]|uniref:hypothetical protein n=1 Tax=Enterobacter bugandensis TaxID=881260 RepID=UPI000643C5C1|nr:hypothetical protein [Enterobacter bugandensis]KLQ32539.1 hypothetical protein ABR33_05990 [Enterobacter bugandensis]
MKHFLHLPKFKDDAYGTNTPDTMIAIDAIDILSIQSTGQDPSNPTDISDILNFNLHIGDISHSYAQAGGINLTQITEALESAGMIRVSDVWLNISNLASINAVDGDKPINEWAENSEYGIQAELVFKSGLIYNINFTHDNFGKFIFKLKKDIQL